jgi:hypothetical protein
VANRAAQVTPGDYADAEPRRALRRVALGLLRRAGCLRFLIGAAVLLFLFATPPGLRLVTTFGDWFGHLLTNAVVKSVTSPSPKP